MPDINWELLLSMMLQGGAAMNQQPWAKAVDGVGQQYQGAKGQFTMIDLYKKMLAGEGVPEGGKLTMDDKGMSMMLPKTHLKSLLESDHDPLSRKPAEAPESVVTPSPASVPVPAKGSNILSGGGGGQGGMMSILNPSGSQSPSFPDVAGIGPTDVSNALSGALGIEGLKQRRTTDVVDMIYKMAQVKKMGAADPLDANFPIPHPEAGNLSLRQWKSLPAEEREYAAYIHAAKKIGAPEKELNRKFFAMLEPTEKEQFLRAAIEDPALMEAEIKLREAGASSVNIGADTLAREQSKQQAWVLGPKAVPEIKVKLEKDKRSWRSTIEANKLSKLRGISVNDARSQIQQAKVRAALDRAIRAVFSRQGTVTYRKGEGWFLDGKLIREDI